jgi:hypothetical protein
MDFVFDRIASGRTLKCLAIVDDATHEAVAVTPEHTIGGDHLTRILDSICSQRGKPTIIRTDNVLRTEASHFAGDGSPVRDVARHHEAKSRHTHTRPAVFRDDEILADHNEHKIRLLLTVFTAPKTA